MGSKNGLSRINEHTDANALSNHKASNTRCLQSGNSISQSAFPSDVEFELLRPLEIKYYPTRETDVSIDAT